MLGSRSAPRLVPKLKFENPTLQHVKVANRLYKPENPTSHPCCSRLASARFQQTCISPALVELHMANTRRSKLKPWKTKPIQATSDPQFALVRNWSFARERLDQPKRNQTQGTSPALVPNRGIQSAVFAPFSSRFRGRFRIRFRS